MLHNDFRPTSERYISFREVTRCWRNSTSVNRIFPSIEILLFGH